MRPISRKVSPSSERCVENTVPYASPHSISAPSGERTAPKSTVMLSPAGTLTGGVAQRGEPARLAHRGGLLGSVKVDFDDLRPALGRLVLAGPANEPRFDRGEGEYVLPALAVARAAEFRPSLLRRATTRNDSSPARARPNRPRARRASRPRRDQSRTTACRPPPPSTPSRSCRRWRAGARRCWRRLAIGAWAGLSSELPTPSVWPRRRTDKGGLWQARQNDAAGRLRPPRLLRSRRSASGVISSQRARDGPGRSICLGRQIR